MGEDVLTEKAVNQFYFEKKKRMKLHQELTPAIVSETQKGQKDVNNENVYRGWIDDDEMIGTEMGRLIQNKFGSGNITRKFTSDEQTETEKEEKKKAITVKKKAALLAKLNR